MGRSRYYMCTVIICILFNLLGCQSQEPKERKNILDVISLDEITSQNHCFFWNEKYLFLKLSLEDNRYEQGNNCLWLAKYEEAKSIFEELAEQEENLEVLNGLALAQYYQGEYDLAEATMRKALEKQKSPYQEAVLLNNMGIIMEGLLQFNEGDLYYDKALEILEDLNAKIELICVNVNKATNIAWRNNLPETSFLLEVQTNEINNLSQVDFLLEAFINIYLSKTNYALTGSDLFFQECYKHLEVFEKSMGKNHPITISILDDIASMEIAKQNFDVALEQLQIALKNLQQQLGEEHPSIATTNLHIGLCYIQKGMYDEALQCYTKAVEISQKTVAGKLGIFISYSNLGSLYGNQRDYEKAMEYFLKTYQELHKRNCPYDAQFFENTLKFLNLVYKRMDMDESKFDEWLEEQMDQMKQEDTSEDQSKEENVESETEKDTAA